MIVPKIRFHLRHVPTVVMCFVVLFSTLVSAQEVDQQIRAVHDPVIAKEGDTYYLFGTGAGIPVRCSEDLNVWELCSRVFFGRPSWHREKIPGVEDIWAPDITYMNDRHHLYYAVSIFGTNRSAIGLATNVTLDPSSSAHEWTDEGVVIESVRSDDWNAIDPNVAFDRDGHPWLSFGSYWSGIKLVRLDLETGKLAEANPTLYPLASRPEPPHAVEAPFLIYREPHYYLFVSFDACCRGVDSTYNIRVGRAEDIIGPYLDRDGVPMLEGGGTILLETTERWRGPGHNAVFESEYGDLLVYHAYDAEFLGSPTLRIDPILWGEDGWPHVTRTPGVP